MGAGHKKGFNTARIHILKGEAFAELGKFSQAEKEFNEAALLIFLEDIFNKEVVLLADEAE